MIIKNLPAYAYMDGVQKDSCVYQIAQDTEFVERYKTYTTQTQVYNWQDQTTTNPTKIVNDFFGFNLMSTMWKMYLGMAPNQVIDPDADKRFTAAKLYPTIMILGAAGDFGPYNGQVYLMNGCHKKLPVGYITYNSQSAASAAYLEGGVNSADAPLFNQRLNINYNIFREDLFNEDGSMAPAGERRGLITVHIEFTFENDNSTVNHIRIYVQYSSSSVALGLFTPALTLADAQAEDKDPNDPFENTDGDGNDGGDGENLPPVVEPVDVPGLPSTGVGSCGILTIYTPTLSNLQALGSFLWSGAFDPASFKKLFTDPMQSIIGLGILPIVPSSSGSKNIRFGNVDSGVNSSYVSDPFVSKNMGSVKITKDVGSFLDYTDTKISIYLPYLGFRTLSADDVMDSTITVVYNVDCLTGACAAFIKSNKRGVLYAYNGSCITNIPLTGQNFSGAIQNAISAVASGAGVLAGMASGAAPVTAMGAMGLLTSAANCAVNSKPEIQRSGNLGGSAGILSVQKPYLIIQRPVIEVPGGLAGQVGNVSFKAVTLGNCSGFTLVERCHLENITATANEISEIETMLKQGVIL